MSRIITTMVDEERSQSRARVAICLVSLLGFFVIDRTEHIASSATVAIAYTTILAYLSFALFWLGVVSHWPGRWPRRRYLGMFADIAIMVYWMHLGDEYVTSYYPIFLWVIIGNGIRFGPRFLTTGIAMGAMGFALLLQFDSYWTDNLALGIGLLIGVVVLPVFFLTVLRRLQKVSRLELELAKSRLADRAKDEFLATMSHELRTPMNGVLGMTALLKDSKLDAEQREQVEVISRSVDSLLNIINDILDYSKIKANQLTLESIPFDLERVLADVHQLLASTAAAKHIDLRFTYPGEDHRGFRGDPTRVRQIAFNLVGNALKFTSQGGVELCCTVLPERARRNVRFEVTDSGIGIPAERQAAIFEAFEQVDRSVTRKFGGSGLGLSISRQIAELMDGDISVRSQVGVGSTFTVELTLPPCELPRAKAPAARPQLPCFDLRALIVEDNTFNQLVTRQTLAKLGITSDVAENGAVAVEMVERETYDLVFMDIRMPVMDGYESSRRIRALPGERGQVPIIAVTAEVAGQSSEHCLAAGMNGYLAKPLRIDQIADAIEQLICV